MRAFRKFTFAFVAGFLPERFPRRRPRRMLAAAACLLVLALCAGAAGAQSSVKLVGNTGQSTDATSAVGLYRAQAFTTGGNSGGYTLTAVEIEATNTPTLAETSLMGIYQSNASNRPRVGDGSPVGTLSRVQGSAGTVRFETPRYALKANTTYFAVLFRRSSDGDSGYDLTNSNAEDSGAASGWSIGDGSLWKNGWNDAWSASGASLKMTFHGRSGPVLPTGATVNGSSLTLAFDETLDEDSVPAAGAFRVSATNGSGPGPRGCHGTCWVAVSEVSVSGSDVMLTLAEPIASHWTVQLTYQAPAANPLQSAELGNRLAESFDKRPVSVLTPNTAPVLYNAYVAFGKYLWIEHNEPVTGNSVPGSAFALTATSGGVARTIAGTGTVHVSTSSSDGYSSRVRVTLASAVGAAERLRLSYVKPSGNQLHDRDNAPVESYSDKPMTNRTQPGFGPTGATVSGSSLTLAFDQALDEDSAPAGGAFRVLAENNGGPRLRGCHHRTCKVAVSEVSISGSDVVLTLAEPIPSHWTALLRYEAPAANPLRSAAPGGFVQNFYALTVSVLTPNTAPVFHSGHVAGNHLTVSHNEAVTGDSVPGSAFTVTATSEGGTRTIAGTGTVRVLAAFDDYTSTVIVTLASAVAIGERLTVSYVKPSANQVQDRAGAPVESYSDMPVTNNTQPVFFKPTGASVNWSSLTLTFDRALDEDSVPAGDAFRVWVTHGNAGRGYSSCAGSCRVAVSGVSVVGATAVLTLAEPVPSHARVSLRYDPPDANPLRSTVLDELAGSFYRPVSVLTPNAAPVFDSAHVRNGKDLFIAHKGMVTGNSVPGSAFTVTATSEGGASRTIAGTGAVRISAPNSNGYNSNVVVTLASAVAPGERLKLSYAKPSGNQLRDPWDIPVESYSGMPVTNWQPKVEAVAIASDPQGGDGDTYGLGDTIRVQVTFYVPVIVDTRGGVPRLKLDLDAASGSGERWAIYEGGSNTDTLTFAYEVAGPDVSTDGVAVPANGVERNGGQFIAYSSYGPVVEADLSHTGLDHDPAHKVDWTTPGSGGSGDSGPSHQSSSVSGTRLKVTFDEALDEGSAPPGGSFKVTVAPGEGAGGNGGAGANGGGFGTGAQATSGGNAGGDIEGTGTVTVNGAEVVVTLARPAPPGATLTVSYTPPDTSPLRDLEGEEAEEFSGQPVTRVASNRAPVVDEGSSNYAGFVAQGNAPRGVLVTKGFHGMFSDPDGDELIYTVALSDPGQAPLVEVLHVPTEAELAETPRRIEVARRVFFRADAEADWGAMNPAVPDPVSIAVTVTATDPDGLTASVEGVFLTHWAAPRVESVAVVSNAGSDDTYALGETIRVAVRFDGRVAVDTSGGTPRLAIDMDPADWGEKWASYASGSGTRELVFAYEVVEPNYSTQGIAVLADTLEANGGTIRLDTSYAPAPWMDADLAHPGLGHDPKHKVDWGLAPTPVGAVPEVTGVAVASDAGPDDTYALGDVIRVAVTFDAAVTVTGSPGISIDMDPAPWGEKRAAYESGSGTSSLVFAHTVVEPNFSTEGIAVVADSLALEGGAIRSAAGADATLAHAGLAHDASHKVDWRPELSVADARADEGAGATVDFVVSLSRAFTTAAHAVTVDYATADGTATAGEDYTAASGTLTFAAGETVKTVRVALLDDAIDEGEETFTLRLSNARGARIADGEATGTIVNSDPMPRAWLARFGRAAAEHVTDAIGERLRGSPGTRMTLGGHELDWSADPDALQARGDALFTGPEPRLTGGGPLLTSANGFGLNGRTGADGEASARELSMPDLLLASSFHMASADDGSGSASGSGRWSVWGRGARSSFEGMDGRLTLEGDVTTATLGFDYERGHWLAGVALSRSSGEGSYEEAGMRGEVESSLTGVYPYARYRVSESLSLWGVVGFGAGDMTLEPEGTSSIETDIETGMAAAGARGVLLPAQAAGGFELALRADLMATATASDAADNLVETEVETSRLRLLLEASREFRTGADSVLAASVEAGLRYDGGDAETGSGLEAGGSLRWTSGSLSVEVAARGLMAHSEDDYEEWGVSGSVQYAPGTDGRGFSLKAGSAWGAAAGGAERIWSQRAAGLAGGDFAPGASVDAEAGYGFGFRGGLLTPYTGVALSDTSETWRAGARWKLGAATELALEANLRENAGGDAPESGLLLKGSRRW